MKAAYVLIYILQTERGSSPISELSLMRILDAALIVSGVAILAIYAVLSLSATFAGVHTIEVNATAGPRGLPCAQCHPYIRDELGAGPALTAHLRAANNTNYTTYLAAGGIAYNSTANESYNGAVQLRPVVYSVDFRDDTLGDNATYDEGDAAYFYNTTGNRTWEKALWSVTGGTFSPTGVTSRESLDLDSSGTVEAGEACLLCHGAEFFGIDGTHTKVVVRACDDDRCHGNANRTWNDYRLHGNESYLTVVSAGKHLSTPPGNYSVHETFYNRSSQNNSSYADGAPFGVTGGNAGPGGGYISQGHWTCLGCHTGVGAALNITQPTPFPHSNASASRQRYL